MAEPVAESYRDLLEAVESVVYNSIEADADRFHQALQTFKPLFTNLLHHDGPSAEARAAVQSCNPMTRSGRMRLDPDPDVKEVLLLSDELQLDELLALECMATARYETGQISAEAAAGVFFEERRAVLSALHLLLQTQALPADDLDPGVLAAVSDFNARLLSEQHGGRGVLLQRLMNLIKDSPLGPPPGSALQHIVDPHGNSVRLDVVMHLERTRLCECLVYAVAIQQRVPPADVEALADLLHSVVLQVRGTRAGDLTVHYQACMVLIALMLTLAPVEAAQSDEEVVRDEEALVALAGNATLAAKLGGSSPPEDGFMAAARLGWGLLLAQAGVDSTLGPAQDCCRAATQAGAFGFLRSGILDSPAFRDDMPFQRELYSGVLHQLAMLFLDSPEGKVLVNEFCQSERARQTAPGTPAQPAQHAAAQQAQQQLVPSAVSSTAGGGGFAVLHAPPDSLPSLLGLLAGLYSAHPDLFLDDDLRAPVLGQFMEYVALQDVLPSSPDTFVAYFDVLSALATGEKGAAIVYGQLRAGQQDALLSWGRMLGTMLQYCGRLLPTADAAQGGGKVDASDLVMPEVDALGLAAYLRLFTRVMDQAAPHDVLVWVHQLEEVAGLGGAGTGGAPLWDVLFQLVAYPVPPQSWHASGISQQQTYVLRLKSALYDALAALAKRPEFVGALWERLLSTLVVGPGANTLAPGVHGLAPLRYDVSYQLNEVESRSEDYSEVLSFVRLLNALWRTVGAALPDRGRPVAHYSRFVREDVFGMLHQRAYKCEQQKWDLAAACIEHLSLTLQHLQPPLAPLDPGVVQTPGMGVMLDLLGESTGPAMPSLLAVIGCGVTQLVAERKDAAQGAAHEAAVLAALRLLRSAMEVDADVVAAAKAGGQQSGGQYSTLDTCLKYRQALLLVLEYVRYGHNPAVQEAACHLAQHLAARQPHLVDLLLDQSSGPVPGYVRLRSGFAECLQSSLFSAPAALELEPEDGEEGGAAAQDMGDSRDERADIILELLVSSVAQPAPNFTHMLMGFDVEHGPEGVTCSVLSPWSTYSCLRVVLDCLLTSPGLSSRSPRRYERCLRLLAALASDPGTSEATLGLLRLRASMLRPVLDPVACSALPSAEEDPEGRTAGLLQRAWLLRIAALEMHFADPALGGQKESLEALAADLLFTLREAPQDGNASMAAAAFQQRPARMVEVLRQLAQPVDLPALGDGLPPRARSLMRSMDIDALLAPPATSVGAGNGGAGGVWVEGESGDAVVDVAALKEQLVKRYNEFLAQYSGAPGAGVSEEVKGVCRSALRYAQRYNAAVAHAGAHLEAVASWQALVEVAVTERFDVLNAVAARGAAEGRRGGPGAGGCALDVVHQLLPEVVAAASSLLAAADGSRAVLPLCQVAQTLVTRLQEQATSAATGALRPDGATADLSCLALQLPSRCHDLLGGLLSLLRGARHQPGVRHVLHGALLQYMLYCRGPRAVSGARLPKLLEAYSSSMQQQQAGGGGGGSSAAEAAASSSAAARLDDAQLRLESGNAGLLRDSLVVVEALARDALPDLSGGSPVVSVVALMLLGEMVAADSLGAVADAVHASALPGRLLQDLVDVPRALLLQAPHRSRGRLHAVEAGMDLLLRLLHAPSPGSAVGAGRSGVADGMPGGAMGAAQRLFLLDALPKLASCRALDLQPEEPGGGSEGPASMRHRLHKVVTPALRLVLGLALGLPSSAAVREQAAAFLDAHSQAMARILHDASSVGVRGWEPGESELEEADLVVQLAAALGPHMQQQQQAADAMAGGGAAGGAVLRSALYTAANRLLASNSRSASPPVQRLHAAAERGGAATPEEQRSLEQLAKRVLSLRCSLVAYLGQLVASPSSGVVMRAAGGDPSQGGGAGGGGAPPTLLLVRDALYQATCDLYSSLDDEAAASAQGDGLGRMLTDGNGGAAPEAATAQGAAGGSVRQLLYLAEGLASILLLELQRYTPAASAAASGGGGGVGGQQLMTSGRRAGGETALGSERDLGQLRRLLVPVLDHIEGLQQHQGGDVAAAAAGGGGARDLLLIVRRLKEHI